MTKAVNTMSSALSLSNTDGNIPFNYYHYYDNILPYRRMYMLDIRPISDLRNNFSDIEKTVKAGKPVYLTKNGYGTMVVLSIEEYSRLIDPIEMALDEADRQAASTDKRITREEVFASARKIVHE